MGRRRYPPCVGRAGRPRLRPLAELVQLPKRSPIGGELERAVEAAGRLHLVRSDLAPIPVRTTATTSEAGAYRFRKGDPIDLRVSKIGGRATIGFLHELGHLVDHQAQFDVESRRWASDLHPAFAPWRTAAENLPRPDVRGRYFHTTRELWARCYAQTVLGRSGDRYLERVLVELQLRRDMHVWPAEVFAPVALEVERTLERLGLTQLSLPLAA
jgi:hypothetical protein